MAKLTTATDLLNAYLNSVSNLVSCMSILGPP